jgi:hypothetical protein
MRFDAPFVVKRYSPPIGRANAPRRVTIEARAYSLDEAMQYARRNREMFARIRERLASEGEGKPWTLNDLDWYANAPTWIEHRRAPATTMPGRRAP